MDGAVIGALVAVGHIPLASHRTAHPRSPDRRHRRVHGPGARAADPRRAAARYALYFHLLRLDLVAMWLLRAQRQHRACSGCDRWRVRLGLGHGAVAGRSHCRTTSRSSPSVAAGWPQAPQRCVIAGVGTGIAMGRTYRRGLIGSLVSWAFGGLILLVMAVFFYDSPLLAFPAGSGGDHDVRGGRAVSSWSARRGRPKRLLDRKVEPLAARQVWAGVPVVVAVGIGLAFVHTPARRWAPTPVGHRTAGGPATAAGRPTGLARRRSSSEYTWVQRASTGATPCWYGKRWPPTSVIRGTTSCLGHERVMVDSIIDQPPVLLQRLSDSSPLRHERSPDQRTSSPSTSGTG